MGGWLSYTFYQYRIVTTEILTGITWKDIPTDIIKANKKDSLSISGLGLSIGINSWIKTFHRLNFGLRAIYTYSTYDKSKYLASPIGGHSLTFSLVYRFPRRSQESKNGIEKRITSHNTRYGHWHFAPVCKTLPTKPPQKS